MTGLVTTADIAREAGIQQRTIQKRIKRLGIQPFRLGAGFLLTTQQAERVLKDKRKPGPKGQSVKAKPIKKSNGNGK